MLSHDHLRLREYERRLCCGQPARTMPRNKAASALTPVSAPKMARPAVLRARACREAVTPEMATTISFTTKVVS